MEPTKVQKNLTSINKLKEVRIAIQKVRETLSSQHNSELTKAAEGHMRDAEYNIIERMVELGMTLELKEGKE